MKSPWKKLLSDDGKRTGENQYWCGGAVTKTAELIRSNELYTNPKLCKSTNINRSTHTGKLKKERTTVSNKNISVTACTYMIQVLQNYDYISIIKP
jgi:hypothetical protein